VTIPGDAWRARWWALLLAGLMAWPVAAGSVRAGWDGSTRAGLAARAAGRYAEAEDHLRAAVRLAEPAPGSGPRLARSLTNLADLYLVLHRYEEAEPLLQRALGVEERRVGGGHPAVAAILADYVVVLRELGRQAEVPALEARLQAILADPTVRDPSFVWDKPGAGPEDLERDEAECVRQARYGGTPYGPLIDPDRFTRCVEERGWRKTVVQPAKEAKDS
jgi:tetratricopeptide (TPR) repeat protein